jgi:hypothetical protein
LYNYAVYKKANWSSKGRCGCVKCIAIIDSHVIILIRQLQLNPSSLFRVASKQTYTIITRSPIRQTGCSPNTFSIIVP